MSSHAHSGHAVVVEPSGFIRKYIFSIDHKVIGIQYFLLALTAVVHRHRSFALDAFPSCISGRSSSVRKRRHHDARGIHGARDHARHHHGFLCAHHRAAGGLRQLFSADTNRCAGYGVPAPKQCFSFWVTFLAFVAIIAAFVVPGGAPISGWTGYTPLSGMGEVTGPGEGIGQTLWIVSISLFCLASLLGALNFIATTIDLRAPGMTLFRMPLTVWGWFVTAILGLFAFGVLLAGGILLLLDRSAGTSFFLPAGLVVNDQVQPHSGGSPLLWQHLFWFFGHPEVYIAILPVLGRFAYSFHFLT